jgi:voltage-gated potassium channel
MKLKKHEWIWRKLLIPLLGLGIILIIGFIGYIVIEGYTPLDSLYMLVIMFSTIGFQEVHPLSPAGHLFTIFIIISGFTFGFYFLGKLSSFFLGGELTKLIKSRRMEKLLNQFEDHYIVCGFGKTGKRVTEELLRKGRKVVLIENDTERNEKAKDLFDKNLIHLIGDATDDELLKQAGVERARILIAVLTTDAENLFVTISAKDLNKKIKVITRVEDAKSASKFKKAGADYIISQIDIATDRIIALATSSSDFFSFVEFADGKEELKNHHFKLVEIRQGSEIIGKTFREANIPQRTNLIVIGRYLPDHQLQVNPKAHDVINLGDQLLVFGTHDEIQMLRRIGKQSKSELNEKITP